MVDSPEMRPRSPEVQYVAPSEADKLARQTALCRGCNRVWHRQYMPCGSWLCLNCSRSYQREQYAEKQAKKARSA